MTDKQYPSLRHQFNSINGEARRLLARILLSQEIFTSKEAKKNRQKICNECDQKDWDNGRCRACGCFLLPKFQVASAECPLGKWGQDDATLRKAYEEELDKEKNEE
jgi:hypothetical protein